MTTQTQVCPHCQAELPPNAPLGICPKCLLQAALPQDQASAAGGQLNSTSAQSGKFVPPDPAALARHFPQLETLEFLGRGGMGAVYKARQSGLDRVVAVKILPPEIGADPAFAERFSREARTLAKLSHQNIISIFDFGQADGQFYFIMEYVDGANLRQLMEADRIPSTEALDIVHQICDALQFAHKEGVVHRDIKPENILVDKRGRVKIADFGLAKLLQNAPGESALTGTQQVMGTYRYMAPEQLEGTRGVDHRADIFSLGVIFYELLTGELPLGRFDPPSSRCEVDTRLDDVVLRALEKEPARRYQQASDVNVDIDSISSGMAGTPTVGQPPVKPRSVSNSGFSRKAIVAAIWAGMFFLAVPAVMLPTLTLSGGNVATGVEGAPPPAPAGPRMSGYVLLALLLPVAIAGITAPIGTTVLGSLALHDIREAQGKMGGLALALADTLLFPLLLLDAVIVMACLFVAPFPLSTIAGTVGIGLLLSLVVDFLIIRWAWKAATRPQCTD